MIVQSDIVNTAREVFLIVQLLLNSFVQKAYLLSVTLNDHINKTHTLLGLLNCCRTSYF